MTSIANTDGFPSPTGQGISFTPEEMKIMKECQREAFLKRGLPISGLFAYGAYYALKTGIMKPSVRYGITPIIGIAGTLGCLTGMISYKSVCIERMMSVPNSTLRLRIEAALQQRTPAMANSVLIPLRTELDSQTQMVSGTQMESYSPTDSFDGFSGEDIDGDQPANFNTSILGRTESPTQTYDELRRRNRDDYMRLSASSRLPPQQSADPRSTLSQPPIFEDNTRFDKDRVPQYQLVD